MLRKNKHYSSAFVASPIHSLVSDFGKSCTDKSFFRPDISQTRVFLGSMMGSNRVGLYDFPDGKDTGETAQTMIRSKGLDITEVDSMLKAQENKIKLDVASQKADLEIKEDKMVMEIMRQNIADVALAAKGAKGSDNSKSSDSAK